MAEVIHITSFAGRLRSELGSLAEQADAFVAASTIVYEGHLNRGGAVFIVAPDYVWGQPSDELRRLQMGLVPRFDQTTERLDMLFRSAPSDLQTALTEAHSQIREWLARDGAGWTGWDIPSDIATAREMLAERFRKLSAFLDVIAPLEVDGRTIVVPDTSALMDLPSLADYATVVGGDAADIVLVPAVLSELDAIKDQGKTPQVQGRARAAGRSIRDASRVASLLTGAEIAPGIRVFSRPIEPRFESLPGYLDPLVADDRILAAALELQRERPTDTVVLVTPDLNLQTKAESAGLPFVEPPVQP
jgi:hypothetical protein